jgi:hypothetical protein
MSRVTFRPIPYVQDIHQTQDRDPGYTYKNVIITYKSDPTRVQRYLNAGWEIVETIKSNKDDRSHTPNSKEDKLRPQMLVETTSDGHEQILMKILTSKWEQNQTDKKQGREQARLREAQRRGDRILRRGNEIITTGSELSEGFKEQQEI